ncbi:transglycosylase SLT domain-containing protein [Actinomycetospora sp. CA-084318]|uniref:transglycosylase SLT domain-containing protein n=1 Tax=Actinomycetospora sp. CA-084318 TaxID=3239892 RepID=UPI003D9973E6
MAGWGYDVVGALDATPGTEELRAVAARVERVDTGALADLARRYASLADGMDTSARAVADRGEGVGRAWQGPGADAFARYAADFARAGTDTGDAARRIQGELAGLGRTLAALREEVAGHVSDALDLARARPEQVRTAVATPTARARAALDRAEQEVADCARRLRDLADGFTGFSRLRSPDAGVMSASGATSRWTDRQGAVVGADDPVREARVPDDESGESGGSGRGTDDGDTGSAEGSEERAGSDADDPVGEVDRGTGDGGTGSAERAGGDGDPPDDGVRGSRADAADPGNAGRYDTGTDDGDSGADADGTGSGEDAGTTADADSDADDGDSGADAGGTGSGENAGTTAEADAGTGSEDDEDGDDVTGDDVTGDDDADATGSAGAERETGTEPSSGRGGVQDWIRQATAILAENGVDPDTMKAEDIATIIEHESGGDPDAVNNWDSNADKGTPSKGLMQTIGPTFEANKLPGHDDITDPVDNIIAAVRYAIRRYGSVSQVPGVEAVARGDSYVGY